LTRGHVVVQGVGTADLADEATMKLMKWWDELVRREGGNGNLNASGRARPGESGPTAGSWATTTWECGWPIPTTVRVVTAWGRTA